MADRAAVQPTGERLSPPIGRHRADSPDGTELVGEVFGQGPPLVLVHAGLGDGVLDWRGALPFLTERFTCYCMSTRGRGLSADNPDLALQRSVEDVTAFVESVGAPVALAAPSGGAMDVLGAAARSSAVAAAALCDPIAFEPLDEPGWGRLEAAAERMAGLAADGRLADAATDWMKEWASDQEMDALAESGYLEGCAQYVPILLRTLDQAEESDGYSGTDPSVLARIRAPVLILQGSEAESVWAWFGASVRHIAAHLPAPTVHEVAGAGHLGAWVKPRRYAEEMIRFFAAVDMPR